MDTRYLAVSGVVPGACVMISSFFLFSWDAATSGLFVDRLATSETF